MLSNQDYYAWDLCLRIVLERKNFCIFDILATWVAVWLATWPLRRLALWVASHLATWVAKYRVVPECLALRWLGGWVARWLKTSLLCAWHDHRDN